ncbi:MAG TPA: hypothetical protein VF069_27900 [Streptosporangiaceae bacterium]
MSGGNDPAGRRVQGRFLGLPYDWRPPTRARLRAKAWNPDDLRILTPKTYGWGLGINLYWLCHPLRLARARRAARPAGRSDGPAG